MVSIIDYSILIYWGSYHAQIGDYSEFIGAEVIMFRLHVCPTPCTILVCIGMINGSLHQESCEFHQAI